MHAKHEVTISCCAKVIANVMLTIDKQTNKQTRHKQYAPIIWCRGIKFGLYLLKCKSCVTGILWFVGYDRVNQDCGILAYMEYVAPGPSVFQSKISRQFMELKMMALVSLLERPLAHPLYYINGYVYMHPCQGHSDLNWRHIYTKIRLWIAH